jgi:D-alanyl-D-alanine carboxypeptidase
MLRTREDLPVARRQQATKRPRPFPIGPVVLSVSLALGGGLAALFLLQEQLLERWSPPAGLVEGIEARPDGDGRLLGHFPYPEAAESELVEIWPGIRLQRDAAAELQRLLADARRDGIRLTVVSAFRSVDIQNEVFFNMKSLRNQSAEERAKVSAPPGYSEHSTGFAVDFADLTRPQTELSESFESTPGFAWLKYNAHRYHFTLSFPRANAQGLSFEPWHWRFEGSAKALEQFEAVQRFQRSARR